MCEILKQMTRSLWTEKNGLDLPFLSKHIRECDDCDGVFRVMIRILQFDLKENREKHERHSLETEE